MSLAIMHGLQYVELHSHNHSLEVKQAWRATKCVMCLYSAPCSTVLRMQERRPSYWKQVLQKVNVMTQRNRRDHGQTTGEFLRASIYERDVNMVFSVMKGD